MPRGMKDTCVRQLQALACSYEGMRDPIPRDTVAVEREDVRGRILFRECLSKFKQLRQDALSPRGERYPSPSGFGLALEHFDRMQGQVNRAPGKGAYLSTAQPGITKEGNYLAHARTICREFLYDVIRNDVLALVFAGKQFQFRDTGDNVPILCQVKHPAKCAEIMIDRDRAHCLAPMLDKVLHQGKVDLVQGTGRHGREVKQGLHVGRVELERIFGDAGGKTLLESLTEYFQCGGRPNAGCQLVTSLGFDAPRLILITFLSAKLVDGAI